MSIRKSSCAALVYGACLVAATAGAVVQSPNTARGFDPKGTFQVGDIDHVNLMNGGLTITLPIGESYPVGGELSYGINLVYNSQPWDFDTFCTPDDSGGIGPGGSSCIYTAYPSPSSNVGMGWRLSLGEMIPPHTLPRNGSEYWMYVGPDGAQHLFYSTLRGPEPTGERVGYTRDGSYLRLKPWGAGVQVEFPNGDVHLFDDTGRLQRIEDAFGNFVAVTYDETTSRETWTISDSLGRSHTVVFYKHVIEGIPYLRLSTVDLQSFQGRRSVYTFGIATHSVEKPLPHNDPNVPLSVNALFLGWIQLPDGSYYRTPVHGNAYVYTRNEVAPRATGLLKRIQLPTLGQILYGWQAFAFPNGSDATSERVRDRAWATQTAGIASRQRVDRYGNDLGTWTYEHELDLLVHDSRSNSATQPVDMRTVVTDPFGTFTVHYFHAYGGAFPPTNADADPRDYGLPFSVDYDDGTAARRYLSRQVYSAGGSLLRSVYVKYEREEPTPYNDVYGRWDLLRRPFSERTVYHDDNDLHETVDRSDFDGYGHYRWVRRSAPTYWFSGAQRITYTDYSAPSMVPLTSRWILDTYDSVDEDFGGEVEHRQTCFDRGLLTRERRLRAGRTRTSTDVVVELQRDGSGNATRERRFGGDTNPVGTSSNLCAMALGIPAYDLRHAYQHGVRATSWHDGRSERILDLTVDASGKVASSRDISGIQTTYDYDLVGRLIRERPQSGQDGQTWYSYTVAAGGSPAKLLVERRTNGGGGSLAQTEYQFDDLGRLKKESVLRPGNQWVHRSTTHDAGDRIATVSELGSGYATQYQYDPFGRVIRVTAPDGKVVKYHYTGVRQIDREEKIAGGTLTSGTTTEFTYFTQEIYDREGKLRRVVQPAQVGLTANYTYDVGGRLVHVQLVGSGTSQTRSFDYDGRGFLLRESHPEHQPITYASHDARGNAGRVSVQGGTTLSYERDAMGRVTRIADGGGFELKRFTYATGNLSGDWRKGKMVQAVRSNWVQGPWDNQWYDVEVTEDYQYRGRGGRVSYRRTTTNIGQGFDQGWTWNELGDVASLTYPRCTGNPACSATDVTPRTVSFQYQAGLLTGVPGFATAITYHPSGLTDKVLWENGASLRQDADFWGMPRPSNLALEIPNGSEVASLGTHEYDGVGNLERRGDELYGYDGGSRLERHRNGSGVLRAWSYDAFGNVQQVVTGSQVVTLNTWKANNHLQFAGYDAAGNVTSWGPHSFRRDALDMVTARNWPLESYIYTADDERLMALEYDSATGGIHETWTLRDLDGRVLTVYEDTANLPGQWSWEKDYVYRGRKLLAAALPGSYPAYRHYFGIDHLGSPRMVLDAARNIIHEHHYWGFGTEMFQAGQLDDEKLRFTGHERDQNSPGTADDLDYMHARYYSPHLARFLRVDPARSAVARSPGTWNKYIYASNNPLILVDPDGRQPRASTGYAVTPVSLLATPDRAVTVSAGPTTAAGRGLLSLGLGMLGMVELSNGSVSNVGVRMSISLSHSDSLLGPVSAEASGSGGSISASVPVTAALSAGATLGVSNGPIVSGSETSLTVGAVVAGSQSTGGDEEILVTSDRGASAEGTITLSLRDVRNYAAAVVNALWQRLQDPSGEKTSPQE